MYEFFERHPAFATAVATLLLTAVPFAELLWEVIP